MRKRIPLEGTTVGALKIIKPVGSYKSGAILYECLCSCGNITNVPSSRLRQERTNSCGLCGWRRKKPKTTEMDEGKKRAYRAWASMKSRCYNPYSKPFPRYGGRGIQVCDRWRELFEEFYEDMGTPPPGMTLERINNDGDYTPENCTWASRKAQMRNTHRKTMIPWKGKPRSLAEIAKDLELPYKTLSQMLRYHKDITKAIARTRRLLRKKELQGKIVH